MAKPKKKPTASAAKKQAPKEKKMNPFDLKFAKKKAGETTKQREGAPLVSRKRAMERRQQTLGVEVKQMWKKNKILDQRIAEKNVKLSAEEKAEKRFMMQRARVLKSHKKFNLSSYDENGKEDDSLTHLGQTLTETERYEKGMESDDGGELDANLMALANFGGGSLPMADVSTEEGKRRTLSRKELIAEVMANSKQAKALRQMAKDEQEDQTEKLDEKLNNLRSVGALAPPSASSKSDAGSKYDSYDSIYNEMLAGGKRSAAGASLRMQEDAEKAKQEEVQRLEAERLRRMTSANTEANHHVSVDAEDTSTVTAAQSGRVRDNYEVRYNAKGEMIVSHSDFEKSKSLNGGGDQNAEDEHVGADEELIDFFADSDDDEKAGSEADDTPLENETDSATMTALDLPGSYEATVALFAKFASNRLPALAEKLIEEHHPRLKQGNKKALIRMFLFVLRLYDDTAKVVTKQNVERTGYLIQVLFKLMKFDTDHAARCIRALLKQKLARRAKNRHAPLTFAELAVIQLIADLFPTSDFWHPVCTPTLHFALQVLAHARVTSVFICARMVLLSSQLTRWVVDSKRYLPEVVAFLHGALMLAVRNVESEQFPSLAFPVSMPHRHMLVLDEKVEDVADALSISEVFNDDSDELDVSQEDKVRVLRALLTTIYQLVLVYGSYEDSFCSILGRFLQTWRRLPTENYPKSLSDDASGYLSYLQTQYEKHSPVTQMKRNESKTVRVLKMLEPKFEEDFDTERPRLKRDPSRKGPKASQKKLAQQVKREKRGAIKELRTDAKYLSGLQRVEQQKISRERNEKTKRVMQSLEVQESEYKKRKAKKF